MAAIAVMLGTSKGAFLLKSKAVRAEWEVARPYCDGWPINPVIADPESGAVFASRDGGDHRHEIARHLPVVLLVEVLMGGMRAC